MFPHWPNLFFIYKKQLFLPYPCSFSPLSISSLHDPFSLPSLVVPSNSLISNKARCSATFAPDSLNLRIPPLVLTTTNPSSTHAPNNNHHHKPPTMQLFPITHLTFYTCTKQQSPPLHSPQTRNTTTINHQITTFTVAPYSHSSHAVPK